MWQVPERDNPYKSTPPTHVSTPKNPQPPKKDAPSPSKHVTTMHYFGKTESQFHYDGGLHSFGFAPAPVYGDLKDPLHVASQNPSELRLDKLSFSITSLGPSAHPAAYDVGIYYWDFHNDVWRPFFNKTFEYAPGTTLNKVGDLPDIRVPAATSIMLGVKPVLNSGETMFPWYIFTAGLTLSS